MAYTKNKKEMNSVSSPIYSDESIDIFRLEPCIAKMAMPFRAFLEATAWLPRFVMTNDRTETRHKSFERIWQEKLNASVADWEILLKRPRASVPQLECHMVQWLRFCSWGQCPSCRVWFQRSLTQAELTTPDRARNKLMRKCKKCTEARGRHRAEVPTWAAWPPVLKDLPEAANRVLSPFVLHQGSPKKHPKGYMRKGGATGVSWKPVSVESSIAAIPSEQHRSKLWRAWQWLKLNSGAYAAYVQAHERCLEIQGTLRLQPSALLEPFLECAVFPVLYWSADLAESRVWSRDWREPFKGQKGMQSGRSSPKAEFIEKLCCEIGDYSLSLAHYDLLQFQFDRHALWIIAYRGQYAGDADLSLLFAGQHWTESYWLRHHRTVLDVCAQLGEPQLFVTIAPYEWSFPWPYWVTRARAAAGVGPTEMSGIEVLSVAHALQQMCAGFLCGHTGDGSRWRDHLLSSKTERPGGVSAYFARFEYQDGGSTHEYGRGRGSVHVHMLIWLHGFRELLPQWQICAEYPQEDPELCALADTVLKGDFSRAPLRHSSTDWAWNAKSQRWQLLLRHTEEFYNASLRPFLRSILRVLRCQMDVQWWSADSALLRYVSGYVAKFAEGWKNDWLDDAPNAFAAGMQVLRKWQPSEAQMIMTLARENMVMSNVVTVAYRVPAFWQPAPDWLVLYRQRRDEDKDKTCREWLRTVTISSNALGHSCARRRARNHIVAVSAESFRFPKDQFFWQWLLLERSHRSFRDLQPSVCELVSPELQHFAACMVLCPGQWCCDDWVCNWLRMQGHKETHVRAFQTKLAAMRYQCDAQINGRLPRFSPMRSLAVQGRYQHLADDQRHAADIILDLAAECRSYALAHAERPYRLPVFVTGGPGSGKSFILDVVMDELLKEEWTILHASPTGRLACSVSRRRGLRATTVHRAFGITVEDGAWDLYAPASWNMWVVGEIGMIPCEHLHHIFRCWRALDRVPLLVFEGDFQQLPPPMASAEDARDQPWFTVRTLELACQHRCDDNAFLDFQRAARFNDLATETVMDFLADRVVHECISLESLQSAWAQKPDAIVITARVNTADFVNTCALDLFGNEWLAPVPIWNGDCVVHQWLRRGSRIMITRNGDLESYANGSQGNVLDIVSAGIVVDLGRAITTLCKRAGPSHSNGTPVVRHAYDVSLAYAITLHKVEGLTLSSAILCFEDWSCDAWGYTALTRFRRSADFLILGIPCDRHFHARTR